MKNKLIITLLLISTSSLAWDMPSFLKSGPYVSKAPELQKYVGVIQRDGRCSFAAVLWPRPNAPQILVGIHKHYAGEMVLCAGDIVINANTLQETHGCAAFYLNGNNLQTHPIIPQFGYNIIKNIACNQGGFEKLLSDTTVGNGTVQDFLIGKPNPDFGSESIVVYSDSKKYLDWYVKTKIKSENDTKAALERSRRENGEYPKYSAGYQDTKGTTITEILSGDPLINSQSRSIASEKR
jgi:hypothetical protein